MIRSTIVLVLTAAAAMPVAAQEDARPVPTARIHGRIFEIGRDRTLEGVAVALQPGNLQATTDAHGRFAFRSLPAGSYTLRIALEGHGTTTDSLSLEQGASVDVLLRMSSRGEAVPPMEVANRVPALERVAFYDRRDIEPGIFLTPQEIERRNPRNTTDLFRTMPSVEVGYGGTGPRNIVFRRGVACSPDIYLDNQRLGIIDVDQLRPEELLAIEVYIGGSIPIRYRSSTCGVILLWSRRRA